MDSLTIYILCHNRPDDAKQAIQSVLAQSDAGYKLIVSDNSSNDEVEQMVRREFSAVNYIRRVPMLAPLAHFNRCITEVEGDYFCLFHDDDIMSPDFVSTIRQCVRKFPHAALVGCNAHIERFGQCEARPSFRTFREYEQMTTPRELAMRYFSRAQSGIAPFPGYVYNRRLMAGRLIPAEGGKYADVTWLLMLAHRGAVIWINRPLMTYRLHASNDGNIESRRDRLRFLGYLKQNRATIGTGVLQDYRCSFIYKKIINDHDNRDQRRYRLAEQFLRHYRWARYTKADTYQSVLKRALIKWMTK
jgi:glycosyltransferase involved in cell wall biosynthesis